MAKRMILMLAVTAVFVVALGFVKYRQINTAIAQFASFRPPPGGQIASSPTRGARGKI